MQAVHGRGHAEGHRKADNNGAATAHGGGAQGIIHVAGGEDGLIVALGRGQDGGVDRGQGARTVGRHREYDANHRR